MEKQFIVASRWLWTIFNQVRKGKSAAEPKFGGGE
jgi:hypothetical protein